MIAASVLTALASIFQVSAPTPTLSIEDAVAIAERSAFSIALQKTALEKANLNVQIAQKAFNPNINAAATYTRNDQAVYGTDQNGNKTLFSPGESTAVNAGFSFPIDINGSLRNRLRAARDNRAASEETLNATLRDVRLTVRAAYFAVLRTQAAVVVQQQALEQSKAQRDRAKLQYAGDQIARIDVTRFETQVVQSESDLTTALNALQLAKNGLNQALARPIETPLEVVDIADLKDPMLTPEQAVATATEVRPEVKSLKRTIVALENTRRVTETNDDPTLSVGSQYNRQLGDVGSNQQRSSMVGTISLNIPITATGIVRKQVQQARQDELAATIQLDQLRLNISAEVRTALTNLESARARYASATQQVTLAEEVFRISGVRRDAGEATYVEVIDAQTQLTQARNQRNNARFDYLLAYSQLQRAVGNDDFAATAPANQTNSNGAKTK